MKHARLAPSAAYRWLNCAAAPRLEAEVSVKQDLSIGDISSAAKLGTELHSYLEECLRLETPPDAEFCPGEIDHFDAVVLAYHYITENYGGDDFDCYIEKKLAISLTVGRTTNDIYGTADFLAYEKSKKILHVVDFKSGVQPVEADSPQLVLYGLGGLGWLRHKVIKLVRCTIIQPRFYHVGGAVRSADFTVAELASLGVLFNRAAAATDDPTAPATAGPWCQWCLARVSCTALYEHNRGLFQNDIEKLSAPPPVEDMLSPEHTQWILNNADQIVSWLRSVQRAVFVRLQHGEKIPGYKLVDTRTNRAWKSKQIALRFFNQVGIKPFKEKKPLITPAEAERRMVEKLDITRKEARQMIEDKVSSKIHRKLVKETDGRDSIKVDLTKEGLESAIENTETDDLTDFLTV